jgi:hypothetical protein
MRAVSAPPIVVTTVVSARSVDRDDDAGVARARVDARRGEDGPLLADADA